MGRKTEISRVAIETTSRCNLACAMCGHPTLTRPKIDMDFDLFVKIVDDIKKHEHRLWQMHLQGEPLMDRIFDDRIRYLAAEGVRVASSFSTNCVLLTPERTDALIDAGFRKVHKKTIMIRLCIDSMDKSVYDQLRIGGNYELAIENARYFIGKMKLRGITVQRLITEFNPDESEDAFAVFGVPIRTQKVGLHHDKSRDYRVVKDCSDRRAQCRLLTNRSIWVMADGRVTGCCLDCDCQQPFGYMTTQSIAEVVAAQNVQRDAFKQGDYSALPMCNACYGNDCTGKW